MNGYVGSGRTLPLTAPVGGVVSGGAYLIDSLFVIAAFSAAAGQQFLGVVEGIFDMAKVSAEAWTAGARIYWDDTADLVTTDSASGANLEIGSAVRAATGGSVLGRVRLHGSAQAAGGGGGNLPAGLTFSSPTFTIATGAANQLVGAGSTTTNPVTISAAGSDADIAIWARPKGDAGLYVGPDPSTFDPFFQPTFLRSVVARISENDLTGVEPYPLVSWLQVSNVSRGKGLLGVLTIVGDVTEHVSALGGDAFSSAGTIAHMNAIYGYAEVDGGTVDLETAFYAVVDNFGGSVTTAVSFYAAAIGPQATNAYGLWLDEQGVFRIRADNAFDSVYQAIPALYNPQFTKYTPGAADHERFILARWNGNVAEIGTEKGGTGTLRGVRLLGAALLADALKSTTAPSGHKQLMVNTTTGEIFASTTNAT